MDKLQAENIRLRTALTEIVGHSLSSPCDPSVTEKYGITEAALRVVYAEWGACLRIARAALSSETADQT